MRYAIALAKPSEAMPSSHCPKVYTHPTIYANCSLSLIPIAKIRTRCSALDLMQVGGAPSAQALLLSGR